MTQSTAHVLPSHPPSSSSHPHRRTPSFNPPKVKSARPTLHRRSTTHHSIFKLGSGQPKQSVVQDNSHSEMAASFLNFWYVTSNVISLILPVCLSANILHSAHSLFLRLTLSCSAMCERQITVPDNSLLYCSERSVFAYKNLSLPSSKFGLSADIVLPSAAVEKTLANHCRLLALLHLCPFLRLLPPHLPCHHEPLCLP